MRFELFAEYFPDLLAGIPMMLQLAGLSLLLGFFLAVLLAVLRTSGIRPLEWFVRGYVYVFRGTPLLVQIFLIYYGTGNPSTWNPAQHGVEETVVHGRDPRGDQSGRQRSRMPVRPSPDSGQPLGTVVARIHRGHHGQ